MKNKTHIAIRFGFVLISLIIGLSSCKNAQEATGETVPPVKPSNRFKELFHEAVSEKMIGHYDRAIVLFEECLKLDQTNGAVHFALSELYEIQGDYSRALESAKSAYTSDKTNKWYAIRLAQIYYNLGDYSNSAVYFEIGITEDEQNLELKYQYAETLINSRQYAKAIAVLDEIEVETGRILELTMAKHDMYRILGQPEKAENEIRSLLEEDPQNTEVRIRLGTYYLGQEQFEKAKQMAEDVIRINPAGGEGYFLLGDTELRQGHSQRAFDLYAEGFSKEDISLERKLEMIWTLSDLPFNYQNADAAICEKGLGHLFELIYDPALRNETLHTYYGSFLLNQGKSEEALKQFKIVCDLNGTDFTFWNQLLFLERELGAYKDLYEDGQKGLELFPSQPVFYLHTGVGAYEIGKFTEAEEFLFLGKDLVVNNDVLLADFYVALGEMSCLEKKTNEGYAYFEQAKRAYSAGAKPYGVKAKWLLAENRIQEAEAEIKAGLLLNEYDPDVLHVKGLLMLRNKDYPGALETLEKAVLYDNKNGLLLEHYGDALFLNGQKEKAVQLWKEARKHGNKSDVLTRKIADSTYYEN